MNQTLINLALALAATELIHNLLEVSNIRRKVARLQAYINKEPYKEMSMNIDTRPKAYSLTTASFIVLVGVTFGVFSLLDIGANTAFKTIVTLLIATYFITGFVVDKYHVEIEKVTRKFKR